MSKKTVISILLAALSLALILGCSKKDGRSSLLGATQGAYTEWLGTGFSSASSGEVGLELDEIAEKTQMHRLDAPAPASRSRQEAAADTSAEPANVERKLVKRADLRIRVENLEKADASVAALLQKYEAYAASTSIQENAYYYSLRVPAVHYDAFLAEMNGMGRLLRRNESTEDVTLRYYDLEGRLETKKELLRTFQSYLRTAKTIEEILKVEARISELQYDIEGTGKQLRALANQVDYATIDLNLVGPAAATPSRGVTFGERIKQMFGGFGGFLSGVVIAIVGIVIYGVPILALVVLFFWLLFGRVGLLKKLWRLVRGKKQNA